MFLPGGAQVHNRINRLIRSFATKTMTQKHYDTPFTPQSPDTVSPDILEAMDYFYADKRPVDIEIKQPEFTSVCPMTGLPDFGCITITYRPDRHILELKSLKYYLMQYRNVGIFYEHVVNRILNDLSGAISPLSMTVIGEFTSRGGLSTTVKAADTTVGSSG